MKECGNRAMSQSSYLEAEEFYTKGINKISENSDITDDIEVHVWQLYSNRCAARIKYGNLHEALDDAAMANKFAPKKEIKPLLRCAEALSALWYNKEAKELLTNMITSFPESEQIIRQKIDLLAPKCTIRVGNGLEYTEIADAVNDAPIGALVLVEPGIYTKPISIHRPITIECTSVDDNAAIDTITGSPANADAPSDTKCKLNDKQKWAILQVEACTAIRVGSFDEINSVNIIGLNVMRQKRNPTKVPLFSICSGLAILRNCVFAGNMTQKCPIIVAKANLIIQSSAISGGTGILAQFGVRIQLYGVHCYGSQESGLRIVDESSAQIYDSFFYQSDVEGVTATAESEVIANNCSFSSNNIGVSVSKNAWITLTNCVLSNNIAIGLICKDDGHIKVTGCVVENNITGVKLSNRGSGTISTCKVGRNRGNGIIIDDNHLGAVLITENDFVGNSRKGISIRNDKCTTIITKNTDSSNGIRSDISNKKGPNKKGQVHEDTPTSARSMAEGLLSIFSVVGVALGALAMAKSGTVREPPKEVPKETSWLGCWR